MLLICIVLNIDININITRINRNKNKQKYTSYIFITVPWSEVPDHVSLTGADHQIKRASVNLTWSGISDQSYCYNDKFII